MLIPCAISEMRRYVPIQLLCIIDVSVGDVPLVGTARFVPAQPPRHCASARASTSLTGMALCPTHRLPLDQRQLGLPQAF